MAKSSMMNICVVVGSLVLLGILIWVCMRKSPDAPKRDGYMAAGAMDHLDSLDPRYNLVEAPEMAVPAEHFADLVNSGDQARLVEQPQGSETVRPLERFDRIHEQNLMPSTAAHLPQFNIDAANPSTYSFAVNAPRVQLKNRIWMLSDPFRGDIPIRYHADVPLIAKSSNGRDSQRMDGFFSDGMSHLYNKLTGRAYKNMPLKVATEGTVVDYI